MMPFRIFCLFSFSLLLFLSCSSDNNESSFTLKIKIQKPEINTQPIIVPDSILSIYGNFDISSEQSFKFVGWDQKQQAINIFDEFGFKNQITVDQKHFSGSASSISYISTDSIFVLRKEVPFLYLFNNSGRLINKWDLSTPYGDIEDNFIYLPEGNNFQVKLIDGGSKILVSFLMMEAFLMKDKNKTGSMAIYDLEINEWIGKPFGKIPNAYLKADYPFTVSHPDISLMNKNRVAISFPLTSEIEIYDLNTHTLVDIIRLSKDQRSLGKKFPVDYNSQDEINYVNTQPFYSGLYFNSEQGSFLRFYFQELPLRNNDGKLNQLKDRKVYLTEINLQDKTYSYSSIQDVYSAIPFLSKFCSYRNNSLYVAVNSGDNDDYLSLSKIVQND